MDFTQHFARYQRLLDTQDFDEKFIDYSSLEKHLSFLRQLAVVENSSMAVFDLYQKKYVFFQSRYLEALGKTYNEVMDEGPRGIFSIMHPDDIGFVIETHYRTTDFFLQLPKEERKEYKSIYQFRLMGRDGEYLRFIQQLLPLELDLIGNIWLMLMVNDVFPDMSGEFKLQRRLVNVKTGKLYLFNDEEETNVKTILSKREIEILGLLAKGMASRDIAEKLFISVNTVNNHRRNILEKTNAGNTTEAINYAESIGII